MPTTRAALAALLFLVAGCASYEMTLHPPALGLQPRTPDRRCDLSIAVASTYAPYVDGHLDLGDLYPRDGKLGEEDRHRYRDAFEATRQFRSVTVGPAGNGLHCDLKIVSGREPAHEFVRVISILFTAGLLAHHQREIITVEATVSAPGRAPATYAVRADIDWKAVHGDSTKLRRPTELTGPEKEIAAALAARFAHDSWLAAAEASR